MKKILLLVTAFALTLGLAGCDLLGGGGDDDGGITSVTINGLEDQTVYVDTVVNLLDGVTVSASDGADYTSLLTVASDNCTVSATKTVTSAIPAECVITFTAVVEGVLARTSVTVTFENEPIITDPDAPLVKGFYFDTDADLTGWGTYTDGGGAFNSEGIEDGAWKLDTTSSSNSYGTRKDYMGIPFEKDETYTVTFKAKSSVADKKINVQVGELVPAPTYFVDFKPGQTENFTLTTEWAEYTFSFVMAEDDNANGGILFEMGNLEGSEGINAIIYFDDIEIRGGSGEDTIGPSVAGADDVALLAGETFDAAAGVTANDSNDGDLTSSIVIGGDTVNVNTAGVYNVTYTVSDAAGNETVVTRKVTVYDFTSAPTMAQWTFGSEGDLLGWVFDANVKAISGALDAGTLKVDYTSGGNPWEPRLFIQGLPFENGESYMVEFKAKSSVAGKILNLQVGELLSADPWFTNFKSTNDVAELTTDWQTFYYVFDMTIDNANGGLLFEFGNVGTSVDISGTVWIDDIKILGGSGVDSTGPSIIGAEDIIIDLNDTFDPEEGVSAFDLVDGDVTDDIVITGGPVDTTTAGVYTLTYTVEDAAENETVVTRKVTVIDVVIDENNAALLTSLDGLLSISNDETQDWWGDSFVGDGKFTASYFREVLSIVNEEVEGEAFNSNLWDAILFYQSLNLINGVEYRFMFEAKTSIPDATENNIIVKFESNQVGIAEQWITLDDEYTEYEITFTYNGDTTIEALLMFMIGGKDQTVSIKNMEFYISTAGAALTNQPIFSGLDDITLNVDDEFDPLAGVSAIDIEDGELTLSTSNVTVLGPNDETTFDSSVEGDWTFTYTFTDSDGNVTTEDRVVTVQSMVFNPTTIVANGDFETDLSGWIKWSRDWEPVITSALTHNTDELLFTYDGVGGARYENQVIYENPVFEFGKTYKLSFDAKGDEARDILVAIFDGANSLMSDFIGITTEYQTYEFIFTYTLGTAQKIEFDLGAMSSGNNAGSEFYLDNVLVEELDQPSTMMNSDFEDIAWTSWIDTNAYSGAAADATVEFVNGEIQVDIVSLGGANWAIQLLQENLEFVSGTQYKITFDAMAETARDINVKIIAADGTEYLNTVSLTTSMATYEVFVTFAAADQAGKLDFELGAATNGIVTAEVGLITFDNILVEEYDGSAVVADTNQIMNSTIDEPLYWGTWLDTQAWSGGVGEATYTVEDGLLTVDIIQAGGAGWAIQLSQPLTLEVGTEYTVSFVAYAAADRTITANVGYGDPFVALGELVDQAITVTPTVYTFTFTAVDTGTVDTLVGFQFGGDINDVFIESVHVYVNYN